MPGLISVWTNRGIELLAAVKPRGLKVTPQYYYAGLALLVVLMLIALVKAYRVWEEIHDVEEPDSPADLLDSFEEAHAAGELDDEELERVRRRLASPATGQAAPPEASAPDQGAPPAAS